MVEPSLVVKGACCWRFWMTMGRILRSEVGMFENTRLFFWIFGALTIIGGVIGFVKAKSKASIIAGSVSGVLLLLAAWLMTGMPSAGMGLGLAISVLLAGRFVPAFLRTRGLMPAGLMRPLGGVGVGLEDLFFSHAR